MVRRSSENVSAVEVEGILRGVDGVLEAAVVPVPDELRGEEVKAYLELDPGAGPDDALLARVFEHCAKNLARFKIPRYVEFVEEFPRTPSLKIKKSAWLSVKEDLRVGSFDRVEGAVAVDCGPSVVREGGARPGPLSSPLRGESARWLAIEGRDI